MLRQGAMYQINGAYSCRAMISTVGVKLLQQNLILSSSSPTNIVAYKRHSSTIQSKPSPIEMSYSLFQPDCVESANNRLPLVIAPGLFGSKNNWRSLAKLISKDTNRNVYTVDPRNHGESPHVDEIDYYAFVEDFILFLKQRSITQAYLMGHSMGGRIIALLYPEVVAKLISLDIGPNDRPKNSYPQYLRMIEYIKNLKVSPELQLTEARKSLDKQLLPAVQEDGVRSFLLTNLYKTDEGFKWRVNWDAIGKNLHEITRFPMNDGTRTFSGETHFVGGTLSDLVKEEYKDEFRMNFPNAQLHYVEGAGHWLHADKPKDFLEIVTPLIKE